MGSNPAWIIPVIGLTGAVSPGAASISQREGDVIIVPERRPLSDDRTNDGFGLDGATGARDPADVGGKFSIRAGVFLGGEVAADHFDCGVVHYFPDGSAVNFDLEGLNVSSSRAAPGMVSSPIAYHIDNGDDDDDDDGPSAEATGLSSPAPSAAAIPVNLIVAGMLGSGCEDDPFDFASASSPCVSISFFFEGFDADETAASATPSTPLEGPIYWISPTTSIAPRSSATEESFEIQIATSDLQNADLQDDLSMTGLRGTDILF